MAKHHPQACRLALGLVRDNFGEVCAAVYDQLLRVGAQTLRELLLRTETPHLAGAPERERRREVERLARAGLQVLLQQNLAHAHLVEPEPSRTNLAPEAFQLYSVRPEDALRCLMMPHCLRHVHDRYSSREDEDAGALYGTVAEVLLKHGRLTLEQVVAAVAEEQEAGQAPPSQQQVQDAFTRLLLDHYIERAPPCSLPPPPPPVFAKTGGRRASALKPGSEAARKADEGRARQEPAVAHCAGRFQLPQELLAHEPKAAAAAAAQPDAGDCAAPAPTAPPPKSLKRKRKTAAEKAAEARAAAGQLPQAAAAATTAAAAARRRAAGAGRQPAAEAGPVLWRVCQETCLRQLRYAACAEHMESLLGDLGGFVARALLAAAGPGQQPGQTHPAQAARLAQERLSAAVTVPELRGALLRLPDLDTEELPADLPKAIQDLSDQQPQLLQASLRGGQTAYSLALGPIVEQARLRQLQGHILQRFGATGLRVWACLGEFQQMETRTVQERVKLPPFEVRSVLYSLARANLVGLQDIPKTNDHAVTKTFHTLKVEPAVAAEHMLACMMRAACALRERLPAELAKRQHVLKDMERGDHTVVQRHPQAVREVQCILSQMDCLLLELVPSLLLFSDF